MIPMEEELTRIDKNEEKATHISYISDISYILQFINSAMSMASSLSNFINNIPKGTHKIKYK